MPVTRINNNQISDASAGNTFVGINAAVKLQNYSITATKIANNLTYGSDLTITGNLTVQGNTTTIDTTYTVIEDPILLLASNQTGTPSVDIGFVGQRGTSNNIAFVWDESAKEFITAYTTTGESNTVISIASYADIHSGNANIGGNAVINGTTSLVGNLIGAVNATGNITGGNLITPGLITATGAITSTANITGGNLSTGGRITATGNIVSAANVSGGNVLATTTVSAPSFIGTIVSVTGNVNSGNVNTTNVFATNGSFTNNVTVSGTLTSTSNIVANTSGIFYGNSITGNAALFAGVPGFTPLGSNIVAQFAGNVNSYSQINFENTNSGNRASADFILTADNGNDSTYFADLGIASSTHNDPTFFGDSGSINDAYLYVVGNSATGPGSQNVGNLILGSTNGNIKLFVGNTAQSNMIQNISTGGVDVTGRMSATGNVTGGNLITGGLITATGNITSTANVAGGNVIATTTVSAPSHVGTIVSVSGNVTGGNVVTGGLITATGNITSTANVTGGNLIATTAVATPSVTGTTVTITTTGGAITLNPSGNVSVSNKNINNLAQPVQDNDAASKIYVDNMVSTQLAYHQAVAAATTGTLEAATGGTITYNQPNGAGNGVGATLTVSGGTFNLIDTANIQTANTRVLVKNQANAVLNGVYIWSNATVLTRATDADTYGPNSSTDLSINDYFFVQGGNVNAGSAWIVDAPSGTITFGTSSITFAQFSSSQTYTGGNGITLVGTVITAKVDNNTTAFDGGGNIIVKASANLTTPNIGAATGTSLSVTGNLTSAGAVVTGNVTGGNLLTSGLISSTGNITSAANISGGNLIATTTVSAPSHIGTIVSVTGNITGGNLTTAGLVTAATVNAAAIGNAGAAFTGASVSAATIGNTGAALSGATVSATANITGGNLLTGGLISSTGNITSAANIAGGNIIATTTVSAPSIIGTIVSVSGNVTGGNLITGGLISATGTITSSANITGGNLLTGGLISSTGNITSAANVVATNLSATGNITGANINTGGSNGLTLNGSNVNSNAGRITINSNSSAIDFAVNGSTANVFYVNGTSSTASFGNSRQITNAVVAFNATNSLLMPVGTTVQRPSTGVTGMLRFNSTLDAVEVYNSSTWSTVGTPSFTVVTDDQFTGNGVQTAFTLANAYTTNSVIVSINGVVQIPTSAYSVSGNALTFTEAPQSGDLIDVRGLTTTTQVVAISNSPGTGVVQPNATLAQVDITGNLMPIANNVQTIGNATLRWKDLFLSGNSMTLGNIVMRNTSGNTVAFYGPDGTTPATIDSTNVDTTTITNGTSNVSVASSGGNVRFNIGGTSNVMVVNATGASITGDLLVTGNATLSGNILGDRVQNGTTAFDIQTQNGNANITVSGTSNVAVFAPTGVFVTGITSVSGNVTGGNIVTAGLVSAAGVTVTGDVTLGGNIVDTGTGLTITTATNTNIVLNPAGTGVIVLNKDINNGQANGVGNIGSATGFFNTVFARATSAQYADLAENYCADAEYAPGTVLSFGGENEVTVSTVEGDRRIAGVVSTNPSYIMNSTLDCEFVATVALTGRVPTLVSGPVTKGDMMVSAGNGRACACATPAIGTVIGKALENHAGGDGVIEVVVGRL